VAAINEPGGPTGDRSVGHLVQSELEVNFAPSAASGPGSCRGLITGLLAVGVPQE